MFVRNSFVCLYTVLTFRITYIHTYIHILNPYTSVQYRHTLVSPPSISNTSSVKMVSNYILLNVHRPIPVAVRSKEQFCGFSIPGIEGSNLADGTDVCLLGLLCVV